MLIPLSGSEEDKPSFRPNRAFQEIDHVPTLILTEPVEEQRYRTHTFWPVLFKRSTESATSEGEETERVDQINCLMSN